MKKQILAPSILALFVASAAHAGATFDTSVGSLYLGGDVEFDYTSETDRDLYSSGRLLVDINGQRSLDNGYFAAFKVNPTFGQNGGTGVDDVWFKFGMSDNWALQAGHFEATDLSPAGQDTFVASSGTAMYRANFARGRLGETDYDNFDGEDDAITGDGQMTFTKTIGDSAGFEMTAQSRNEGEAVIIRPLVTFAGDKVSAAFGGELPVMADESEFATFPGQTVDDGEDWYGVGGWVAFQATDDLTLTARGAFLSDDRMDDNTIEAYTAGLNVQFQNFFIAALYGETDADIDTYDEEETQVYASYKIAGIMGMDNFDIYLGAGWSDSELNGASQDEISGARVRLKYIF